MFVFLMLTVSLPVSLMELQSIKGFQGLSFIFLMYRDLETILDVLEYQFPAASIESLGFLDVQIYTVR